jgi:hypothetical protein
MFGPCARLAFVTTLLASSTALAQPWVGDPHELTLQATTELQFASEVYEDDFAQPAASQSWRDRIGVSYVPIEKLELHADLTWQMDRYTGNLAIGHGDYDDGDWHGHLTDLTASAMYTAYDGALAISPALVTKIPVGDYDSRGYAAAGTGLNEVGAGLRLGKAGLLDGKLLFWGGYTFTFVQKDTRGGPDTSQFRTNYSLVDGYGGYFINDKLVVAGGLEYRLTHDGFDISDGAMLDEDDPLFEWHDAVLKRQYLAINLRGAYWLTDRLSAAVAFGIIPTGVNVSNAKSIALQLSWTALEGD